MLFRLQISIMQFIYNVWVAVYSIGRQFCYFILYATKIKIGALQLLLEYNYLS